MISKPTYCFVILASFVCLSITAPVLKPEDEVDTAIVESTVREVRAVKDSEYSPTNYHKEYDSGDDGDIGYTRQKSDKGKSGYQKFDSFHKKGGDSYGYEKHDSFGKKGKAASDDHSDKAEYKQKKGDGKSAKYQADDSGSYDVVEDAEGDYESDDGGQEEGEGDVSYDGEEASEAEGDIEESGYDEADAANYNNPTSYSYGSGNEYDF